MSRVGRLYAADEAPESWANPFASRFGILGPVFRLRFFFEPGSGIALWAGNVAARERFGTSIDAADLPLSQSTWRYVHYLCAWYDTSLDWSCLPNPGPWSPEETARFHAAVARFLPLLRNELGPSFVLDDEFSPRAPAPQSSTPEAPRP